MRSRIPVLVVTMALALPAAATAATVTTTTVPAATVPVPTVPTTTTPVPAPVPVPAVRQHAKLHLTLERVNGKSRAAIAGDRIRVRGLTSRYVARQHVTIRLFRHGKKIAARSVLLQPFGTHGQGRFVSGFTAAGTGTVTVQASHRSTARLATMVAPRLRFTVLKRYAAPGSRGLVVRRLQGELKALGYVVGRRGSYDARTARAVVAFRKLTGMARTDIASGTVFVKLGRGAGAFHIRYPDHAKHVEADLTHQVIALINHGKVERIYPISSGKPSTPTVLGSFHFYSKSPGTNEKGMVFSNYFIRGYAIHGYYDVPVYAASHGCLRVPVPDAIPIYDWISLGDGIDVYYR